MGVCSISIITCLAWPGMYVIETHGPLLGMQEQISCKTISLSARFNAGNRGNSTSSAVNDHVTKVSLRGTFSG